MNARELYDAGRHHYKDTPPDHWTDLGQDERDAYEWLCLKDKMRLIELGYNPGVTLVHAPGVRLVPQGDTDSPSKAEFNNMSFQAVHLDSAVYDGRDGEGAWKIGIIVYTKQVHLTMQRSGKPGMFLSISEATCRELAANLRTVRPRQPEEENRPRPLGEETCDLPPSG